MGGIALFPPDNPVLQAVLVIIISGLAAAALPYVMPHRWTYAVFLAATTTPLIAYLFYLGSPEKVLLAVLMICYTGFMLHSSVGIRKALSENLASRFRQTFMAEEVAEANRRLTEEAVERRRAEDALRKSEALFRAVVEKSSEVLVLTDPDSKISYVSPSAVGNIQCSPEDLVGTDTRTLVCQEDRERFAELMSSVRQEPAKTSNGTLRIRCGDEVPRWVEITARDLLSDPDVGAIVLNIRDITRRKEAQDALKESENKFRDLVEQAVVGVYLVQDGIFKYVNSTCAKIHGYDNVKEMDGLEIRETIFHEDWPAAKNMSEWGYGRGRDEGGQQFRIVRKDGEVRYVETYGRHTTYRGKQAIIGMVVDVTDRKRAEEALRWKTTFLEALVESSQDGILVLDTRSQRVAQNGKLADILKMPDSVAQAEDEEARISFLMGSLKNPKGFYKKLIHLQQHPDENARVQLELRDGTVVEASSYPVLGKDSMERYGRIWMFRDITEITRYWNMLEELSTTDGLTGLSNRRRFDECMERRWRRAMRECSELSLLLIDIDYFKQFNDRYGHLPGDDCLIKVAAVLKRIMRRGGDVVARYGGEEFACVLPHTGEKGALRIAQRIVDEMARLNIPHEESKVAKHVTVSIGVATEVPDGGQGHSRLVERADRSLYAAKRQGRNRVVAQLNDHSSGKRSDRPLRTSPVPHLR